MLSPLLPYIKYFPKRFVVYNELNWSVNKENIPLLEMSLFGLRFSKDFASIQYLRQYGHIIDRKSILEGKFVSKGNFMFIKDTKSISGNDLINNHIMELPEGEYLCFFSNKSLENKYTSIPIKDMVPQDSSLILAIEYENNLGDYGDMLPYEFEILLN